MNNIKETIDWIDRCRDDAHEHSSRKAPAMEDLLEILNMTTLAWDGEDSDSVPPQCPDRTSYVPYLDSAREAAVVMYIFSMYESLSRPMKKKSAAALKRRMDWDVPAYVYEILATFHESPLAVELVRHYAAGSTFSISLAEMMVKKSIHKKEWIDILRSAPNRFLPADPVELAAYPGMKEYREKRDKHLDDILAELERTSGEQ